MCQCGKGEPCGFCKALTDHGLSDVLKRIGEKVKHCAICDLTEQEVLAQYPEDGLQHIKVNGFDFDVCPHCAHLSWYKIVVKCKECGSVTTFPRSFAIYERFAQKMGVDEVAIALSRQDFMSMNLILFMDGCPSCKIRVAGVVQ